MRTLFKILTKESLISFVALIVLLLLVWFGGEFLHAKYGILEVMIRILVIVIILGVWLLLFAIQKVLTIRAAMLIEKRLRAQADEQMASVQPGKKPEVEALESQLSQAIQALKTSRFGRGALYALPWYMIIGPPGVGKTTALVESGLNFTDVGQGRKKIRGVGGTRNCDWWFTDQGILLDTAGRYTTELEDLDEWLAFLEMLKRSRKRKPINGALVAVSVPELLMATAEEVENHAKNIRQRIDELTRQLELVFPVYLIFTKCDLLSGFTDFFERLTKSDRAQVWGTTIRYTPSPGQSHGAIFAEEAKKLYAALCVQRVTTLSVDLPYEKKRQIYAFPLQFAMAQKRLGEFVEQLFQPNPYQESSLLRGFYFTSGTQEGAPIDQIISAMGAAFGLKEEAGALVSQVTEKKSYFLHDLFTKVIFPDQNLAKSSTRVQKRAGLLRQAGIFGCAAGLLLTILGLLFAFFGNYSQIGAIQDASAQIKGFNWAVPGEAPAKLAALERMSAGIERIDRGESQPLLARWLFHHGRKVSETARAAFLDRLKTLIVVPCGNIIAEDLRAGIVEAKTQSIEFERLYELLRVYLALGDRVAGVTPQELVKALSESDRWRRAAGGAALLPESAGEADALLRFYSVQIGRRDLPPIQLEEEVVSAVIKDLAGPGWQAAIFKHIVSNPQAGNLLEEMSPDDFLSKNDPRRGLLLCPGKEQVARVYTKEGYNRWVRSAVESESRALAGKLAVLQVKEPGAASIRENLEKTYGAEYDRLWLDFLAHVTPRAFENLNDALNVVNEITKPDTSPYKQVLEGIKSFRSLTLGAAGSVAENLGAVEPAPGARAPGSAPADAPEDPAWLNKTLEVIRKLRQKIVEITGSGQMIKLPIDKLDEIRKAFETAKNEVETEVKLVDKKLQKAGLVLLERPCEYILDAIRRESQEEAEKYWRTMVYDPFTTKWSKKYPFADTGEDVEVPIGEFSSLFKPQTGDFWKTLADLDRLRAGVIYGIPLVEFSGKFVSAVEKARSFEKTLYKDDSGKISVEFQVTLELSRGMADIILRIGKETFTYNKDSSHKGTLTWREDSDPSGAEVQFQVAVAGRRGDVKVCRSYKSPWGALRLFRAGKPDETAKNACPWKWECAGENQTERIQYGLNFKDPRMDPFRPGFFDFDPPEKVAQ